MKSVHFLASSLRFSSGKYAQRRLFRTAPVVRSASQYETLSVLKPQKHVFNVQLNRPKMRNALNMKSFAEIGECFASLSKDQECRVIILSGAGKTFCAGLDLTMGVDFVPKPESDPARTALKIRDVAKFMQDSFLAVGKCEKPVISAIQGACIGAAVDLISFTDVRYCSQDAWFQIKEAAIGFAPDIGSVQMVPRIVGNNSIARELLFTTRKIEAAEAKEIGLVGKICADSETVFNVALQTAEAIATKSPIVMRGIKVSLNYSQDHSVEEGLEFMRNWNMSMVQTVDVEKAITSVATKSEPPEFENA